MQEEVAMNARPDPASFRLAAREVIDIHDIYADTHITWPAMSHVQVIAGGDFLFGNGEGQGATFTYAAPLAATSPPLQPQ